MNPTLLVIVVVCLANSVVGKAFEQTVDPFTSINVCVPYTIQISASDNRDPYIIKLDVDQDVYDAFTAEVSADGELTVTSAGDFESANPIKVTIKLPADKLKAINAQGLGYIYVSGNFKTDELKVTSGGTKAIYADKLSVDGTLSVVSNDAGDITLGDSLVGNIDVTQTGVSNVYLLGVSGDVSATLSGISTLGIDSAAATTTIDGTVSSRTADIFFTDGACDVDGCQKVDAFDIEPSSTFFTWTCGIQAKGNSVCSDNVAAAQTSTSNTGTTATSTATASSTASSTGGESSKVSSSNINGEISVSAEGENAATIAISDTACDAPMSELYILEA